MSTMQSHQGANLPPGRYVIDVNEGLSERLHQIALSGTGTVTVTVYVPGEAKKDGTPDDAVVGELPIADGVFDLATPQVPLVLEGFVDAFVLTATGTFSYRIHSA